MLGKTSQVTLTSEDCLFSVQDEEGGGEREND